DPLLGALMETEGRRSGSLGPFLLVVTVILVTAALVYVLLVPTANCKDCAARRIRMAYEEQVLREEGKVPTAKPPPPCERCRDRYKITLFNKWFGRPSPSY